MLAAALRKAEEKLNQLITIRKELGSKNFGNCIKCGTKIPIERLLIIPESKKCVSCA